ncbi:hypothetical protein LX16_0384 [Stackebrandtia albiflava]|uniref:Winged helix-turn-helix domain-containing protein n=1 Tax=Stackebrandtia albiflava TaxID=406432 RepID=A0A562VA03_9ACTN|nr:crosslink repair DNA glycosylase YcaQ family protein [Stackebrandtia albiflava]TWJ14695.1 hypothetical protein LX16_0384 [Stackebrandtia albiflava]
MHELSPTDARRIAVRAQLLDGERHTTGLLDVVRHLSFLQLDPVAAVAPSADLVAWSRLGDAYSREHLVEAIADRSLVEYRAMLRPAEDMVLHRGDMAAWPGEADWRRRQHAWVVANDACRRDILRRLAENGPSPSRALPDTCVEPWRSTGWTDNKNVTQMLEFLTSAGEVAVAGRKGRERLWDLASRVYPDVPALPPDEARVARNRRRLRYLGIARATTAVLPGEPAHVAEVGERAVVAGTKGEWRVDPSLLDGPFTGRAALLSPFDRLVHDRGRLKELFGYEYQLEMYKPVAKRRWGYYALPVLYGDRMVGKLDATADRRAGVLRVHALHRDVEFTPRMTAEIGAEIEALARWLGMEVETPS